MYIEAARSVVSKDERTFHKVQSTDHSELLTGWDESRTGSTRIVASHADVLTGSLGTRDEPLRMSASEATRIADLNKNSNN